MASPLRKTAAFVVTVAALAALFLVAVNAGSLQVTPEQLFNGLFVAYDDTVSTIYDLRFPRIFVAMAGGAATAVSGAFCLLLADTIGCTIAAPHEISAAVVMSIVGGPAFILLLRKAREGYGE